MRDSEHDRVKNQLSDPGWEREAQLAAFGSNEVWIAASKFHSKLPVQIDSGLQAHLYRGLDDMSGTSLRRLRLGPYARRITHVVIIIV